MKFWFLAGILILSSCSKSILIQTDQINEMDLSRLKTFKFVENESKYNLTFNEANEERIKFYIAEELEERNYVKSEAADIHIKLLGNIEIVRETAARDSYYGPYNRYYPPWGGNYHGPRSENESSLIINIIDGASQKLVWQGVATGNFQPRKKHIEAVIAETIAAVFAEFPYESRP